MATPVANTGDDLIIISDDVKADPLDKQESTPTLSIVSGEPSLEVAEDKKEDSLSFDLSSFDSPKEETKTSVTSAPVTLETTEEVESQISATGGDRNNQENMDDILQETIGKLKIRQENISGLKKAKLGAIDIDNGKISMLQDKVEKLKSEVEGLDGEYAQIEDNVSSLESMKTGKTPGVVDDGIDVKAHNLKRVVRTAKV